MYKLLFRIIPTITILLFCSPKTQCNEPSVTLSANGRQTKELLEHLIRLRGLEPIIDSAIQSTTTLSFSEIPWNKALKSMLDLHQLDCRFADDFAVIFPRRNQYAQTTPITPATDKFVSQQELLKRAGLQARELPPTRQTEPSEQNWQNNIQAINQIGQRDNLNIRPRFGHLDKRPDATELSKKLLLQEEPLAAETKKIKNEPKLPDEAIKEHKGISLVGVTGPDDDRSAILMVDGVHRLVKKGSTVSGYKTVSSIEQNRIVIAGENGEVQVVQF